MQMRGLPEWALPWEVEHAREKLYEFRDSWTAGSSQSESPVNTSKLILVYSHSELLTRTSQYCVINIYLPPRTSIIEFGRRQWEWLKPVRLCAISVKFREREKKSQSTTFTRWNINFYGSRKNVEGKFWVDNSPEIRNFFADYKHSSGIINNFA